MGVTRMPMRPAPSQLFSTEIFEIYSALSPLLLHRRPPSPSPPACFSSRPARMGAVVRIGAGDAAYAGKRAAQQ